MPRRIINQKLSYNRFVSWSEFEIRETPDKMQNDSSSNDNPNNDSNGDCNGCGFRKIIMLVVKPRPRTRTVENMKGLAKLEWLTTTINDKMFRWLKLNHCHLKDMEIPPRPYRVVFEDDFFLD